MLPRTFSEVAVFASLDGSGDFDGEHDQLRGIKADTGITLDMGRDGLQQLSPPKIASGDFALSDERGLYSPDNSGSPYYQELIEGRPVLYVASHGEPRAWRSATTWRNGGYWRGRYTASLGRHILDDLTPNTEVGNRRAQIRTLGWESLLTRAPVSIPVMSTPLVSECFTAYLDAVSWPSDKRSIAVSDTRLLYYYADERVPWDGMVELLGAEGPGTFYVDRDGVFHFQNRNFRTTSLRSQLSQATYSDVGPGLVHTNFRPLNPLKNIFNRATYTTRRRAAGSLAPIWSLGTSFDLSASQSRTFIVKPSEPFTGALSPTSPTDYTVSGGTVSVSLSASSGLVAFLTVTVTSGAPTVSDLQLRAQPLEVVSETSALNSVDAAESIARFSPIPGANVPLTLAVQGWPEIDVAQAEGVCNAWVLRQQTPRPLATFAIRNADGSYLREILRRRISDRVTLVDARTGLHADVWINAMQLRIADHGGRTVELVLSVERCDALTGAVWDVSEWDDPSAVWGV